MTSQELRAYCQKKLAEGETLGLLKVKGLRCSSDKPHRAFLWNDGPPCYVLGEVEGGFRLIMFKNATVIAAIDEKDPRYIIAPIDPSDLN